MKIKSDNNINEESKSALKKFRQEQISNNIKYHIIFLVLIILVNIGFLIFILIYKSKISEIKNLSNSHFSSINSKDTELSKRKNSIDHKIVNIASLNKGSIFRFSIIFEKSEEFNTIKNLAYDYIVKADMTYSQTYFLYQSVIDSDNYINFMDRISYYGNIFIFIQTEDGNKFGIFLHELVVPNNDYEFEVNTKDIFLYSFEKNKQYNLKEDKKLFLSFTKEKMICLGDDELVIYTGYWTKGGFIKYPLKSFDLPDNINILTGKNGLFYIRYLEIFSFMYY